MITYKTTDINLAACLRMMGYEMDDIELQGNKGIFCFLEVEQSYINDYDMGRVLVEPVTFNNMIKQLTTSVRRMTQVTR